MISRMKRSHLSGHIVMTGIQGTLANPRNTVGGVGHGESLSWLAPTKTFAALLVSGRGLGSVHLPPDAERSGVRNLLMGKQPVACDFQSSRDMREHEDRKLDCKHEVHD
jgi:hypothetical protein